MSQGSRLGLALGSGSARGLAHIGVLQVLAEEEIDVHCVAGTSIGALIGGCWAAGVFEEALDDILGLVTSSSRWGLMGLFSPAFSRSGLFDGNKLVRRLRRVVRAKKIEQLPHRFVAVATDAETGQEVRLFRGDLATAMRASFGIPGVFTPQRRDGRWLVDGGVKAPVPVAAARRLGADVVVAVNLNTRANMQVLVGEHVDMSDAGPVALGLDETRSIDPAHLARAMRMEAIGTTESLEIAGALAEAEEDQTVIREQERLRADKRTGWLTKLANEATDRQPPGMANVLARSLDWMQVEMAELQLTRCRPEVTVEPPTGKISLFDWERADEIIQIGRDAAREALPSIRAAQSGGGSDG